MICATYAWKTFLENNFFQWWYGDGGSNCKVEQLIKLAKHINFQTIASVGHDVLTKSFLKEILPKTELIHTHFVVTLTQMVLELVKVDQVVVRQVVSQLVSQRREDVLMQAFMPKGGA